MGLFIKVSVAEKACASQPQCRECVESCPVDILARDDSRPVAYILSQNEDECILCVDYAANLSSQTNDATRVLIDTRGYVERIGKELSHWNAIDTGVFRMTPDVFNVIRTLSSVHGTDVTMTDLVLKMGDEGEYFSTRDVSGSFWADVDTFEDYQSVDRLLRISNGNDLQRVGLQAH